MTGDNKIKLIKQVGFDFSGIWLRTVGEIFVEGGKIFGNVKLKLQFVIYFIEHYCFECIE
jgi:hypothetical protein